MKSFKLFLEESRKDEKSKTLHAFDMDETLFHHDHSILKVHVKDTQGKHVKSLTNQEFNTHQLEPGHQYDFGDFRSHSVFEKSAHPIHKMIAKLKAIHKNNKNVEIVTARSDMDDKHGFMNALKKHGIDPHEIHVRRAGNLGPGNPAVNKKKVISDLIKQHGYNKVHLYDDSHSNLTHFLDLKKEHPNVEFNAHHVHYHPETKMLKLTTTKK